MAKHYNPFKMWGSWVGLVLASSIIFVKTLKGNFPDSTVDDYSLFEVISNGLSVNAHGWLILIGWLIGSMVAGFLIGWIIHSIIRRLRK